MCQISWQSIEKAESLNSAKRQAVLDNAFHTIIGKVKNDKNSLAVFVSTGSQWRDGR
jgi:hypothetical protein